LSNYCSSGSSNGFKEHMPVLVGVRTVLNSAAADCSSSSTVAASAAVSADVGPGGISRAQLLLANMAAYYAWQQQWCDPQ
jgi:hypothetical protein